MGNRSMFQPCSVDIHAVCFDRSSVVLPALYPLPSTIGHQPTHCKFLSPTVLAAFPCISTEANCASQLMMAFAKNGLRHQRLADRANPLRSFQKSLTRTDMLSFAKTRIHDVGLETISATCMCVTKSATSFLSEKSKWNSNSWSN